MNSYIDETTKEEFTEDITIREALDSIDDMLALLSLPPLQNRRI